MRNVRGSHWILVIAIVLSGLEPANPRGGDSRDWTNDVQREIAAREYEASRVSAGLQAPNRAHDLRTFFESTGVRVHDRTGPGSPQLVGLSLRGVGRDETLAPVSPGEVFHDGDRVEIRRPGLVEWYENSPAGLEQGFTLDSRLNGSGRLVLELDVEQARARQRGSDVLFETGAGKKLSYSKLVAFDAAGEQLAAHFEIPSDDRLRIVVDDSDARYPLVIDPLLAAAPDAQIAGTQSAAFFGYSTAGAGDVNGDGFSDVVVGALNYDSGEVDEGAAFLFLGSAAGIATGGPSAAVAQLESNQAGASMGSRVASAGDVNGDGYDDLLVGAYAYDSGETDEGAFFVYLGGPSGIASGGPDAAASRIESDQVGATLFEGASAGDLNGDGYGDIVVGAAQYEGGANPGATSSGAAFVFLGSAAGIPNGNPATAATRLVSQQDGESFGNWVSSAGDVDGDGRDDLIVGAPFSDLGETDEGAAYVFLGSDAGIADGGPGTASAILQGDQPGAELGFSVKSAGDVNGDGYSDVIVGAIAFLTGQGLGEGSAFVFHGSANGIASGGPASAATRIDGNQAAANLGHSVSGAGDVNGDGYADVIVGAYAFDDGQVDEGLALVFLGSSTGVSSSGPEGAFAKLTSNQASAGIGFSVAAAGDVNGDGYADVITGAYAYDSGSGFGEGMAFVFHGGAEGVVDGSPATAASTIFSNQIGAGLGSSVSGAGDVNGDGYDDIIVGVPGFDSGQDSTGAAFLSLGSAAGIGNGSPINASIRIVGNQRYALFGASVSAAGDVNGDGLSDVIIGAPGIYLGGPGFYSQGAAYIFHGSSSGIADGDLDDASTRLEGEINTTNDAGYFGGSVGAAGDVNGDGFGDVVVGAPWFDSGDYDSGGAFLFLGSTAGISDGNPATAAARFGSDQSSSHLGTSVSGAGDVNGDGYSDIVIGASHYSFDSSRQMLEGGAFVFHGGASKMMDGNPDNAATRLRGAQSFSHFGTGVSSAGDVNNDGFADVVIGAPAHRSGQVYVGAAFVFMGSESGIGDGSSDSADASLASGETEAGLGSSVSEAGDVNGDGFGDVLVGAPLLDSGQGRHEGAAFLYLGGPGGIASGGVVAASARIEGDQAGAQLGKVSGAGDVNGDGFADFVIGAPGFDAGETDEGAAFVFQGNGDGIGRTVLARQLRTDGSQSLVQPWGWTGDLNGGSIEIRMRATHPLGRGRVKLEVEMCAGGLPFGDLGCVRQVSPSWNDVTLGSAGVELSETVEGLDSETRYRWRARVLYADYSVSQPGIVAPIVPSHGPWRRVSGQASEATLLPEPEIGVLLAGGASMLTAIHRRRSRSKCARRSHP